MKKPMIFSVIATICLVAIAYGQPPNNSKTGTSQAAEPNAEVTVEQFRLEPIPELMRLHLPAIGKLRGQLVMEVPRGSMADRIGVRPGDLLLESGGKQILEGKPLGKLNEAFPTVVMRRGRTMVLGGQARRNSGWGLRNLPADLLAEAQMPAWMNHPTFQPGRGFSGGVTASSSSARSGFGSEAVSVSRAGDQISLEMSLPELSGRNIRMSGTVAEILTELQRSDLPEAAKRRVKAAIGR